LREIDRFAHSLLTWVGVCSLCNHCALLLVSSVAKVGHLTFTLGDPVRVVKAGSSIHGQTGVVIETNWVHTKRVKIAMDGTGETKSYLPNELEWYVPVTDDDREQERLWEQQQELIRQGPVQVGALLQQLADKQKKQKQMAEDIEQLRSRLHGRLPEKELRDVMKHRE
jgi:hypothetical protein